MRIRPFLAVAAAAALVSALPAHAAVPTLDGKKVKTLTFKDTVTAPQDNDKDYVSLSAGDRTFCDPPRCTKFTFLYKPAKGVKSKPFSVRIAWSYPVEDYDLYVVQDNAGTVGNCGAAAGTSELVIVSHPVAGHKYTIVVDHYRALPDTVTATVKYATTDKYATTAPSTIEDPNGPVGIAVNCGIS
jgi:hypothetical protein